MGWGVPPIGSESSMGQGPYHYQPGFPLLHLLPPQTFNSAPSFNPSPINFIPLIPPSLTLHPTASHQPFPTHDVQPPASFPHQSPPMPPPAINPSHP